VEKGLNLTYGGEGGRKSQESKDKISKKMTGKKMSLETREKMSNSKKNHSMYNDEWNKKMKETTWKSGTSSKPILQYDLDGNFIREWKSLSEAAKTLTGKNNAGCISNVLNGRYKTSCGSKWKYKNE
jgi:hypothetical protein